MHEEKKDLLALYGILYCSLRHKRTEESLSFAQMSLEETACPVKSKNLQEPSYWATILIVVLCGWVGMMDDSSACHGQRGKGHSVVDGRAPESPLPCSSSSAWEDQGAAPLLLFPHSHRDVLGTLDQGSRDNSVHFETLFSLWGTRTEGRGGCLTCLQQAVF